MGDKKNKQKNEIFAFSLKNKSTDTKLNFGFKGKNRQFYKGFSQKFNILKTKNANSSFLLSNNGNQTLFFTADFLEKRYFFEGKFEKNSGYLQLSYRKALTFYWSFAKKPSFVSIESEIIRKWLFSKLKLTKSDLFMENRVFLRNSMHFTLKTSVFDIKHLKLPTMKLEYKPKGGSIKGKFIGKSKEISITVNKSLENNGKALFSMTFLEKFKKIKAWNLQREWAFHGKSRFSLSLDNKWKVGVSTKIARIYKKLSGKFNFYMDFVEKRPGFAISLDIL